MLSEGARVSYQGQDGRLLSISGDGGHVLLTSGRAAGSVEFVALATLAEAEPSLIADALDAPEALSSVAVRETVASAGEQGLVTALSESGVLDTLAAIGEEAFEFVASRVRVEPVIRPVMAALDTEEQDHFVALTSALILTSAVHQNEDDQ